MVFIGDRRPEQRHQAVAIGAVDRAAKGVDRTDQAFEHRIEDRLRLLRVAVGDDLQRAPDVGEQQSDVFALGLQRRRRRQRRHREIGAAAAAEFLIDGVGEAARAGRSQQRAAAAAEAPAAPVVAATLPALHASTLPFA